MMRGFTILEVLLVIAILGLLAAFVPTTYVGLLVNTNVDTTITTHKNAITRAQVLAQSGREASPWGVYTTTGAVTVFKGDEYATRDTSFDEVLEVNSSITISGLQEVSFSSIGGVISATGTTTFSPQVGDPQSVTINERGIFIDEVVAVSEQSENFFVNTVAVTTGPPGNRRVIGIDLENNGTATSTITEATFTWSRVNRRIQTVVFGGTTVWSSGGVGSPSGNQPSGVTLDIVDVDIGPSTTVDIDRLNFNGCMRGTNFTAVFTFSDASSTSTSFSTGGGCGGGK